MPEEIEHECTDEIVCPYCGREQSDSWEYHLNDGDEIDIECDCGKTFFATANVSISYSTSKACKENSQEHEWEPVNGRDDARKCKICDKYQFKFQGEWPKEQ